MRFEVGALLLSGWLGAACGALDEFDVMVEDSASVPGTLSAGQIFDADYAGSFDSLDLHGDRTFANNDVKPEDVDAIFVKSVRLEDSRPEVNNLKNIIESVELFVSADGLEKKRIAQGSMFPEGASAELTIDNTLNLKPYAVKPAMTVSAEIKLKQKPAFSFTLKTIVTLLVDINLLGA
jgi:hypothetical protein